MVTRKTERLVKQGLLWAAAALLTVGTVYLGASTWRVYRTMATVRAERVEAEKERDSAKTRTTELAAALEALNTPRGVEGEIRARYPLVQPGEVEFILIDSPETEAASAAEPEQGFWSRLFDF